VESGPGAACVGVGVAAVLALLFALQQWAVGGFSPVMLVREPARIAAGAWITLVHITVVAYLAGATAYGAGSADRAVERLRPVLAVPLPRHARRDWRSYALSLAAAGLAGVAIAAALAIAISPGSVSYDPATWSSVTAWHRVLGLVIGGGVLCLGTLLLRDSLRLSRLGKSAVRVDLLDLARLAPFARQGLTNVLLLAGFVTVQGLFLVDVGYLATFAAVFVPTVVIALAALVLPMWGVRGRIRRERQSELARVRALAQAARSGWEDAPRSQAALPPLSDLLAWEARMEAVREWPIDASGWLRLALYLLIPLGSWSGGALVERVIDAALG